MGEDQANARLYDAIINVLEGVSPEMAKEVIDRLLTLQETCLFQPRCQLPHGSPSNNAGRWQPVAAPDCFTRIGGYRAITFNAVADEYLEKMRVEG
jgi:hypothetical protein